MSRRSLGLLAVIASVAAPLCSVPALAAGPAAVTVRVEGAGALEQATGGDWSGPWFDGLGYSVETVKGETHTFSSPAYWSFFVDETPTSSGICDTELGAGDRLLFAPVPSDGSPVGVLDLAGVPATTAPGRPFTVTVTRTETTYDSSFNPSTARGPAAGVAVGGTTTGSDGTARITLTQRGPAGLRATGGANDIRSATEPTCVTDGGDGACGSATPGASAGASCTSTGDDGLCGTKDRRSPRGRITSIREHQRFATGKGPRTLKGSVTPDPSGIARIALRLTRTDAHHRCSTFDGVRERFAALTRCGARHGRWFSAGTRQTWSYLLPSRLPRGRYVLDLRVTDGAGNADTQLQRTRNRVVFGVG
jgi:hypothetical protein